MKIETSEAPERHGRTLRDRGRSKGYTAVERRNRSRFLARRRKAIAVTGVIGEVSNLYEKIDAALKAKDWNWTTLAEACCFSRQHLVSQTERDKVSEEFLRVICGALGVGITDLMDVRQIGDVEEFESEDDEDDGGNEDE